MVCYLFKCGCYQVKFHMVILTLLLISLCMKTRKKNPNSIIIDLLLCMKAKHVFLYYELYQLKRWLGTLAKMQNSMNMKKVSLYKGEYE